MLPLGRAKGLPLNLKLSHTKIGALAKAEKGIERGQHRIGTCGRMAFAQAFFIGKNSLPIRFSPANIAGKGSHIPQVFLDRMRAFFFFHQLAFKCVDPV